MLFIFQDFLWSGCLIFAESQKIIKKDIKKCRHFRQSTVLSNIVTTSLRILFLLYIVKAFVMPQPMITAGCSGKCNKDKGKRYE